MHDACILSYAEIDLGIAAVLRRFDLQCHV
jgi:hypothetical protein